MNFYRKKLRTLVNVGLFLYRKIFRGGKSCIEVFKGGKKGQTRLFLSFISEEAPAEETARGDASSLLDEVWET